MEYRSPGRIYLVVAIIVLLGMLFSAALGGVAGGAVAGYLLRQQGRQQAVSAGPTPIVARATATPAPTEVVREKVVVQTLEMEEDQIVQEIYERVNPSVVNITVAVRAEVIPFNPFLPQVPQEQYQYGSGSGFVYDLQGHIVTNNHVVADAEKITVTFYDGITVPATVVGRDPDSDLAVIKVDPSGLDLKPVELGDSDALKVGQRVVAIGNPFALQGTLTTGVISALGRSYPVGDVQEGGRYSIPDVIQTDAAINPGNSGGPLLDYQGRVVGVTFAIESPVRASAGIGFAIPVNLVKQVVPVLIEKGSYQHPWLGISGTTLTPDIAEAMGLPSSQRGVLVITVTPNSPAAAAGLRPSGKSILIDGQQFPIGGDIIIAVDEKTVRTFDDLIVYLVRQTKVGQEIKLTLLRDGKTITVSVTLAARPRSS